MKLFDLFENYKDDTTEYYSTLRPRETRPDGKEKRNGEVKRINPKTGEVMGLAKRGQSGLVRQGRNKGETASVMMQGDGSYVISSHGEKESALHEEEIKAIRKATTNAYDILKLDIAIMVNKEKAKQSMRDNGKNNLTSEFTTQIDSAYDSKMRKMKSELHVSEIYNYVYGLWKSKGEPVGEYVKEFVEKKAGAGRWGGYGGYYKWTFTKYQQFREDTIADVSSRFETKYLIDYHKMHKQLDGIEDTPTTNSQFSQMIKPNFNIPKHLKAHESQILQIYNDYKLGKLTDEEAFNKLSLNGLSQAMSLKLLSSEEKE